MLAVVVFFALAMASIDFGEIDARTYPHLLRIEKGEGANGFHAALAALKGSGRTLLKNVALILPAVLTAMSTAFVFLTLLPIGRFHAFFAAVLYASSPLVLASSTSGVLLPETFALFFYTLSALLFLSSLRVPALALSAGLASLAAAILSPDFIYAALALFVAGLLHSALHKHFPLQPALLALPFLAFPALATLPQLSFSSTLDPWSLLTFGIAVFPLVRSGRIEREEVFFGVLALLSLILAWHARALAPTGLALAAGFAAGSAFTSQRHPLTGLAVLAFFVFLSITTAFVEPARALALATVLTVLIALGAWMYREKVPPFYAISLAMLLALFHGLLAAQFSKQAIGPETKAAIAWSANLPSGARVALWGDETAFEFESGLRALGDRNALARYLLSNATTTELARAGVTHLIIPFSVFDDFGALREAARSTARLDAFAPTGQYVVLGNRLYAVFSSKTGWMFYPADPDTGNLIEGEILLESGGSLPTGRLLLLKASNTSGLAPADRFIYPRAGLEINLLKLFFPDSFGKAAGVRELSREQGLLILEVSE